MGRNPKKTPTHARNPEKRGERRNVEKRRRIQKYKKDKQSQAVILGTISRKRVIESESSYL